MKRLKLKIIPLFETSTKEDTRCKVKKHRKYSRERIRERRKHNLLDGKF